MAFCFLTSMSAYSSFLGQSGGKGVADSRLRPMLIPGQQLLFLSFVVCFVFSFRVVYGINSL